MGKKLQIKKGDKYGRLVIIKELKQYVIPCGQKLRKFQCKCECGKISEHLLCHLTKKQVRSCGCLLNETRKNNTRTHGMTNTRIFNIWQGIRDRCTNKNSGSYKNYGGRGIEMCDEWKNSFEKFYEEMCHTYKKGLTIGRINNNLGYYKENCKWENTKEQARNRRNNRLYKGKCISEWCEILGFKRYIIENRINKYGWSIEKALNTPIKRAKKK